VWSTTKDPENHARQVRRAFDRCQHTRGLTIIASSLDPIADDFEARFAEAGCDDATIAFQKGVIILEFARRARSFGQALFTGIKDVLRAGARIEHIEPDCLVSLSEIALRAGHSRAAISLFAKGERQEGFFRRPSLA